MKVNFLPLKLALHSLAAAGIVAAAQPVWAAVVLSEDFNDVSGVSSNSATPNVCVNSPCTTILSGLPANTSANSTSGSNKPAGAATSPDTANIRRGDNVINSASNFNAFSTAATNNFLVLGDDSNTIADGSVNAGISFFRIPFTIAAGFNAAVISFDWAFRGTDANPSADDTFTAHIITNAGGSSTQLFSIFVRNSASGYGRGHETKSWGPADGFAPGAYQLEFILNEVSDGTSGNFTQSAVGIDNISVEAAVVPEPSTWLTLACGFAFLALLRAGRKPAPPRRAASDPGRQTRSRRATPPGRCAPARSPAARPCR